MPSHGRLSARGKAAGADGFSAPPALLSAKQVAARAQKIAAAQLLELLDHERLRNDAQNGALSDESTVSRENRSDRMSRTLKIANAEYTLLVATTAGLSNAEKEEVFALFQANMQSHYERSTQGWAPAEKRTEIFHHQSRFLILVEGAQSSVTRPAAFAVWRFDTEECDPSDPAQRHRPGRRREEEIEVAYCYEVQVSLPHRKHGLGRFLMQQLEHIACKTRMRKVMLTVFSNNLEAKAFYKKIGYWTDSISPSQWSTESATPLDQKGDNETEYDYDILSKSVVPSTQ
ncbi:Acetyltransferase (GNAT) domain-containing protein [Ceraceosorus bombacis]|uniref:N-alpha-acetyltransferase 40 n=1 Tax=Ceraceosorus bombacis TaxID=401625 RepID=A0A0P1BCQ8_9BASI|nr:Acetyltransferase (GNAT) domain-containing protein [Ceraceosorus bombacis]